MGALWIAGQLTRWMLLMYFYLFAGLAILCVYTLRAAVLLVVGIAWLLVRIAIWVTEVAWPACVTYVRSVRQHD